MNHSFFCLGEDMWNYINNLFVLPLFIASVHFHPVIVLILKRDHVISGYYSAAQWSSVSAVCLL